MRGKKILITGADGFIGRHLQDKLAAEKIGYAVFPRKKGEDIRNLRQVLSLPRAHVVIHLAAQASVLESLRNPQETWEINVLGTLNILEFCRQNGAKIVFPSTALAYAPPAHLPLNEEYPLAPTSFYALSKVIGEDLCQRYAQSFGIKAVILRFFNVYGPGQKGEAAVPAMINSLLQKREIVVNSPHMARDFIFVDDVAGAILAAVKIDLGGCQIFNIGSGQSTEIGELAAMIKKTSGLEDAVIKITNIRRPGEVAKIRAGIKKAKKILDWQPVISLSEGLEKTYESCHSHS